MMMPLKKSKPQEQRIQNARHRGLAQLVTVGVAMLMVAWATAIYVDPMDDPPPLTCLLIWLWALDHEQHFYLLAAALGLGGPLSFLAFQVPGGHRWYLLAMWVAFTLALIFWQGDRIGLMLELMWRRLV